MSLTPYTAPSTLAPFNTMWDVDPFSTAMTPFSQGMLADPLLSRTLSNARQVTTPFNPILSADVLDMGDKYEVYVGKL